MFTKSSLHKQIEEEDFIKFSKLLEEYISLKVEIFMKENLLVTKLLLKSSLQIFIIIQAILSYREGERERGGGFHVGKGLK